MQLRSKPIRLLLVDDHEIVRAGLRALLAQADNIELVGEADTQAAALAETARLRPDVLLLDIRLPDGNGFEVCRRVQSVSADTRVLFLTAFGDDETVFEGIASGADGYLLKEIDRDQLVQAIVTVAGGQSIIDSSLTRRVLARVRANTEASDSESRLATLSKQERRIIAFVADGKTNKQIAAEMGLSDKTVKNYLSNALDKLQLTRRSQAAALYARHASKV